MTRKKDAPQRPWTLTKAASRVLTPDEAWFEDLKVRVLADCHPWQRAAVEDPSTRISLCIGRGGTKTTTKRVRGFLKTAGIRRGIVVYCATSRAQAEELMWFKLKDMVESYGVADDFSFLDSKLRMTCKRTGATYRLFGVEDKRDAEKLRGQPFDEVQADECGSWDPKLLEHFLDRVIAPRLGERNGALVIGGTPPPFLRGPFYDATRPGSDQHRPYIDRHKPEYAGWLRWSSHAWTLKDVVDLPDAEIRYPALVANWKEQLAEKERKGYSDDHPVYLREWLGIWSADNTDHVFRYKPHDKDGKEWNQWSPHGGRLVEGIEGLKLAIAALPKDVGTWHYVLTMDSGGSRDPFACNVFAFAPGDPQRRMLHVYAFEGMGMYSKKVAEMLIGPDPERHPGVVQGGVFGVIGWPDGMEMDTDQNTLDELGNVYGIRIKKAEKKADYKFGAVELTNGDLLEGRIKIIKGSPLEVQIGQLQWKPDEYGNLKEDKAQANHSTDCLIYARRVIANLFESGTVIQDAPKSAKVEYLSKREQRVEDGTDLESLLVQPDFGDNWGYP